MQRQGVTCLESPFKDMSPQTVASFLRCLYWPEHATPANFGKLPAMALHGVVRLAHQMDVPELLKKLDAYLCETGKLISQSMPPS